MKLKLTRSQHNQITEAMGIVIEALADVKERDGQLLREVLAEVYMKLRKSQIEVKDCYKTTLTGPQIVAMQWLCEDWLMSMGNTSLMVTAGSIMMNTHRPLA